MKKLNLLLLFLLAASLPFAQGKIEPLAVYYGSFIQTDANGDGYWKPDGEPTEYVTTFIFSKDVVEHVTPDRTSTYRIDKSEYDPEKGHLVLSVVSNTENKYIFILDNSLKNFRAIYSDGSNYRLTRFTFKDPKKFTKIIKKMR